MRHLGFKFAFDVIKGLTIAKVSAKDDVSIGVMLEAGLKDDTNIPLINNNKIPKMHEVWTIPYDDVISGLIPLLKTVPQFPHDELKAVNDRLFNMLEIAIINRKPNSNAEIHGSLQKANMSNEELYESLSTIFAKTIESFFGLISREHDELLKKIEACKKDVGK